MAPGDKTRKSTREPWLIDGRAGAADAPPSTGDLAPASEWLPGPRRGKRRTTKTRPRQAAAAGTGAATRKHNGAGESLLARIDLQERQIEELRSRLAKLEARVTRMRAKRPARTSPKPRPR
jgi:hypothetical protein